MNHQPNHQASQIVGMLELLNDIGFNVVYIDNTFYVVREFNAADNELVIETELIGKNVTSIVENTVVTTGVDTLKQRELIQKIDVMKDRRRIFSPNTKYSRYQSTT